MEEREISTFELESVWWTINSSGNGDGVPHENERYTRNVRESIVRSSVGIPEEVRNELFFGG